MGFVSECAPSIQMLTSMPSLFMMEVSIFRIAALMVRGGGRTVRPMLMALERFVSRTVISFFPLVSCRCGSHHAQVSDKWNGADQDDEMLRTKHRDGWGGEGGLNSWLSLRRKNHGRMMGECVKQACRNTLAWSPGQVETKPVRQAKTKPFRQVKTKPVGQVKTKPVRQEDQASWAS